MKACSKCGAGNTDTARLCDQCGSPLQVSAGKTCPSGRHIMDPSWTECAYCRQSNAPSPAFPRGEGGRIPTVLESSSSSGQIPSRVAARSGTQIEDGSARFLLPPRPAGPGNGPPSPPPRVAAQPFVSRNATVILQSPGPGATPGGEQPVPSLFKDRKIVGVLVTYSWSRNGQVFPIREGRNFIGRDGDCEVSIPGDSALSSRNSYITYRQNFVVGDMMVNMNGTDLDGVPIDGHQTLSNYSTIRAGSTHFIFIAVKPTLDASYAAGEPGTV